MYLLVNALTRSLHGDGRRWFPRVDRVGRQLGRLRTLRQNRLAFAHCPERPDKLTAAKKLFQRLLSPLYSCIHASAMANDTKLVAYSSGSQTTPQFASHIHLHVIKYDGVE